LKRPQSHCVKDRRSNLVVLDIEQGAQLFNMAAAMSDERFDEAHDENATYADQEQIRRHQARMVRSVSPAQQDYTLLSK